VCRGAWKRCSEDGFIGAEEEDEEISEEKDEDIMICGMQNI
jgi:hypothetical protein